jgi:hypothetical protein
VASSLGLLVDEMGILKKWLNKLLAVSATRRSPRPAKPSEDHRATPRHLGEKPIHVEEDLRESSALRVKSCDEGAWTVDIRGPNDPTTPEGKPEATTHPGDGSLPAKAEETEDGTHDRLENVTGSPRYGYIRVHCAVQLSAGSKQVDEPHT